MRTSLEVRRDDRRMVRKLGLGVLALALMVGLPSEAWAQTPSVALTPSVASPQKLGTPVTWTAAVQSPPAGHTYGYQFTVTFNGQAQIVRDFSPINTFPWVPNTVEGDYQVSVIVRDTTTTPYVLFAPVSVTFDLTPWVTAPLAAGVVNPTSHPLVALFSGPPCTAGHQLLVRFHPAASQASMTTNLVPCSQESANVLVAGMYPSTEYLMHWEEYAGTALVNTGADLPFTTGALPPSFTVPQFQVNVQPTAHDAAYPVVLFQLISNAFWSTATDLAGNVIWYVPNGAPMARMEAGGNFFSYGKAPSGVIGASAPFTVYDLAGNALLQTNLEILNEQLAAKGYPTIDGFNSHEARHLPNGNLLLLGSRDVVSTSAQGGTPSNPVDIVGDMVLVLDHNLQLVWAWDSFAHEDITRPATLGDQCVQGGNGCPPFNTDFSIANDWLHTNFAQGTADGNIILSQRSQDWVIKINYANGTGDGNVIWRMGAGDDFTLLNPSTSQTCGSPNVFPWFTHQHDTAFQFEEDADGGGGTIMTIFDDGNTRAAKCTGTQNSRGMVLFVNEAARQVYIETLADLGAYSYALGSGQLLAPGDGNLYSSYDNGFLTAQGQAQSTEVSLAGQIVYQLQVNNSASYRTYRMQDLYTPTLPFTATGVYAQTAAPLQFGTIFSGTTEVQPLTISNFGLPGTVTVETGINDPGYTVLTTAQNTCLAGIAAGQSCTLPVEFAPVSDGSYDDLLTLTPSVGPVPADVGLNGIAVPLPQISGISPNYGAPAALIEISGTNFGAAQGTSNVTVGGAPSYVASWSDTKIAILVPSRANSGNLVVTVAGGLASNGSPFTFYPYPAITGFSPASGAVGTPVTITGTGLMDGGGNGVVTFNGIPAAILSQTTNSIQVDVPSGAATGPVMVRANGITVQSSTSFQIIGPVPQISGISPNYGAPAALIGINGTNFGAVQGGGSVSIGGALCHVVSWSNNAIFIQVPSKATTGNLVVTAGGGPSTGIAFTVYPYPAVTGLSPSNAAVGSPVTIVGTGLLDGGGNGAVTFNGVPAAILNASSSSIEVDVPAGATTGPVTVRANGITVESPTNFDVAGLPVPQISGISPSYGAPSAFISITGTNFGATQGTGIVTVGGAPSEVIAWSNTAITIRVPSRATTGSLLVMAQGGASNGAAFTFYPFPSISQISPGSGTVGTTVTITGADLLDGGGNAVVTFNGTPATIVSDTATGIQVNVPAGATSGPVFVRVNGINMRSSTSFTVGAAPPS